MLTEDEFVEQEIALGRRVHRHDGIWWRNISPLYCRPAFEFHSILPGTQRPRFQSSILGYSHHVPHPGQGNQTLFYYSLEGESLRRFELKLLDPKKRNKVRQGLKFTQVRRLEQIEPYLNEMRDINVDHARRLMGDPTFDTPYTFYLDHERQWRNQMHKRFVLERRHWWGAFLDGRLAAYMICYQVNDLGFIDTTKSHSDFHKYRPNDALYYTVLRQFALDTGCHAVLNSQPQREGLNRFKEEFLFRQKGLPYYNSNPRLLGLARRMLRIKQALRCRLLAVRAVAPPEGADPAGHDEQTRQ
jgi:hypothetical protein